MTDETDIYLARCLKNWTACRRPSTKVRSHLLQQAANQARSSQFSLGKTITELIGVEFPRLKKIDPLYIFDIPLLLGEPIYQIETGFTPLNRTQPRLFYIPLEMRLIP